MTLIIQRDLGYPAPTREVWYDGVAGQIEAGHAVCYDFTEDEERADGEFHELERFKVVEQPTTTNIKFFAGIVVDNLGLTGTTAGFIRIALPIRGSTLQALLKVNATIGDVLAPQNGQWYLAADAKAATATTGAGADVFSRESMALAGNTNNTSVTEAIETIFGIL